MSNKRRVAVECTVDVQCPNRASPTKALRKNTAIQEGGAIFEIQQTAQAFLHAGIHKDLKEYRSALVKGFF